MKGASNVEPRVLTYEVQGGGDPVVLVPGGATSCALAAGTARHETASASKSFML